MKFRLQKAILPLLLLIAIFFIQVSQAAARGGLTQAASPLKVFYAGADGGVRQALLLIPGAELVTTPEQADVLVLNGAIPEPARLAARRQAGAGVILVMGPEVTAAQVLALLGMPLEMTAKDQPVTLTPLKGVNLPLIDGIDWNSAPQIRERSETLTSLSSVIPMIVSYEDNSWVLWQSGSAIIFNGYLGSANSQFQNWAYFNYLVYRLVESAGGRAALNFADYPASPVPHRTEQLLLTALLGGLLLAAGLAFLLVRRYSLAHPELLDTLTINNQAYLQLQENSDWEDVGFHRPLGGFMLAFMLGVVMFVPLIIYNSYILPTFILPSAQALGIWGRVTQFFNFVWVFLDMGTSAAFIKFFAQYRVHEPRKAIQYGQIFVWWQALSGAIQVAIVVMVAGTFLPQTAYALYTWSVIIHTFIQIPGFYQVFRHGLMSWQRFDYAQTLIIGTNLILPIIAQLAVVPLMVLWGSANPMYGWAMGGLFGLGFAAYLVELLTFLLGYWLYHRLGYNARLLFLAHFNWETIKSAFRFGVFEMLGSVSWGIGQALEILITQNRLLNYTEIWGNWGLAQNFVFGFNAVATLYDNVMPSISEAISNGRVKLSQYYAAVSYKWGGLISAFIGAVLLAVADRFILGALGNEFVRAAAYSLPLIIWGAVQYLSWIGDNVQLGSNRPVIKAGMITGEQFIRVVLALLLVERFQINGLIIAYFVGLLMKGISAYFINHRFCYPQRFYVWQSAIAPLLAGGLHFLILRWFTGLIWRSDQLTSILIFLIGILFSYPLFAFLYGLVGGWDKATLAELEHAVKLSGFMRSMAWLFWASTALGARLSPLHDRFPIDIYDAAMAEAAELTRERVKIVKDA